MKILKQNLLKTIVGAGLVIAPLSARGQANSNMDVFSDRVMFAVSKGYSLDITSDK